MPKKTKVAKQAVARYFDKKDDKTEDEVKKRGKRAFSKKGARDESDEEDHQSEEDILSKDDKKTGKRSVQKRKMEEPVEKVVNMNEEKTLKRTFPKKGVRYNDSGSDEDAEKPPMKMSVSTAEEKRLEARLFGRRWAESSDEEESDREIGETIATLDDAVPTNIKKGGVWQDEEDEKSMFVQLPRKKSKALLKKSTDTSDEIDCKEYATRLRQAFQRTHNAGKLPTWAITSKHKKPPREEEVDSDEEVVQTINEMTTSVGKYVEKDDYVPRGTLSTSRVPDIMIGRHPTASINVIRFHATQPVVATATENGLIQLFKVSENAKEDHFMQSVELKKFSIRRMEITSNGNALLCGSYAQDYLMKYDMKSAKIMQIRMPSSIPRQGVGRFTLSSDGRLLAIAGRDCHIHLLSVNSMEHIRHIVAPGKIVDMQFFPGGSNELWAITENGQVLIADTRSDKSWMNTFVDEGSVHGTALNISKHGDYLATASDTGFVNVYDASQARSSSNPKPLMAFHNLTTSCQAIAFNSDSQLLAMASYLKQNQLRLAHVASQTVYSNFPQHHERTKNVQSVAFSPHSGFLGAGCRDGSFFLYRINHFSDY